MANAETIATRICQALQAEGFDAFRKGSASNISHQVWPMLVRILREERPQACATCVYWGSQHRTWSDEPLRPCQQPQFSVAEEPNAACPTDGALVVTAGPDAALWTGPQFSCTHWTVRG